MNSDLTRRIAFTLGALLVYRIGLHIPLPGIDVAAWQQVFRSQSGGILGIFAGEGMHRLAIFALGVTPYVTAAIIIQMLSMFAPTLIQLRKEGEKGREIIGAYTRYLAVLLAAVQSYGIAIGLEGSDRVVADPGLSFRLSTVATWTGGTMVLIWLCDQITLRGIGNGLAVVLCLDIVMKLPTALALALDFVRMGLLSPAHFLGLALLAFAAVAAIVFMESARRHLSVQFPRRHLGGRAVGEASVQLPLKLNSAGVIPFVVGGWLMSVPALAALLMGDRTSLGFLTPGEPGFLLLSTMLIVFLAFFYTAFVLDPAAAAETLKRHGGAIAGVAPGEASAEHIDWVASRVTILGAAYLAAVVLIPAILFRYAGVPFYFGGISAMVVVCTVLDIKSRVREARALGA